MASGTIWMSTPTSNAEAKIEWSSYSHGSAANSSNVTANVYLRRTTSYTTTGTFSGGLSLAGEWRGISNYGSFSTGWWHIGGFSRDVGHGSDGNCTINISADFSNSGTSLAGYYSGGSNVSLDWIPRGSPVSSSNFTAGNNLTVNTNRYFDTNHDIYVYLKNSSGNWVMVASQGSVGTSVTFSGSTFYQNCINTLAGRSSCEMKIGCTTYNAGNQWTESGTYTCSAIAASTTNISSWTTGTDFTLTLTRHNSNIKHTVEVYVDGTLVASQSNIDTSCSFGGVDFHTACFNKLAQTASKATTIRLKMYYGGTQVRGNIDTAGTCTAPVASTSTLDKTEYIIGDTMKISPTYNYTDTTNFKIEIKMIYGNFTDLIANNKSNSLPLDEPTGALKDDLYEQIENAYSADGMITIKTTYNGIQVRSVTSTSFTLSANPEECRPNFTNFTVSDIAGFHTFVGNLGLISGKTQLKLSNFNGVAKYGATLKSYTAKIGNEATISTIDVSSSATLQFGTLTYNEIMVKELTVTLVDSRNITTTVTKQIRVFPYASPSIATLDAKRTSLTSSSAFLNFNGQLSYLYSDPTDTKGTNLMANMTYTLQKFGEGIGPNVNIAKDGHFFFPGLGVFAYLNNDAGGYLHELDVDRSYILTLKITDSLGASTSKSIIIQPGNPLMSFRDKQIGINIVPGEYDGVKPALDVNGDIYMNGGKVISSPDKTVEDWVTVTEEELRILKESGQIEEGRMYNVVDGMIQATTSTPVGAIIFWLGNPQTIPTNYVLAEGQILNIIDNRVSKSYVNRYGTLYGGDGTTTVGIPNLKGRVIVHFDGSVEFNALGKTGGAKTHTLTTGQLPSHNHRINTNNDDFNNSPGGGPFGTTYDGANSWRTNEWYTQASGNGEAHNNLQPYITGYYIIKIREEAYTEDLNNLDAEVSKIKINPKTNYATHKFPIPCTLTAAAPTLSKELAITTTKGNPVFLSVSGDNNPTVLSNGSAWFNVKFYRNGVLLAHQLCESRFISGNIPFSLQHLDVVEKGTYTYKVEFTRGDGESNLAENGIAETPQFFVYEI